MLLSQPAIVTTRKKSVWNSNVYCRTALSNDIASTLLSSKKTNEGFDRLKLIALKLKIPIAADMRFDSLKEAVIDNYLNRIVDLRSCPLSSMDRPHKQYSMQDINWFILVQYKKAHTGIMQMIAPEIKNKLGTT